MGDTAEQPDTGRQKYRELTLGEEVDVTMGIFTSEVLLAILDDISAGIEQIREDGVTIMLAEQNVTFALRHADRIALLENGEVVRRGSPEELRDDDYVRESYLGG